MAKFFFTLISILSISCIPLTKAKASSDTIISYHSALSKPFYAISEDSEYTDFLYFKFQAPSFNFEYYCLTDLPSFAVKEAQLSDSITSFLSMSTPIAIRFNSVTYLIKDDLSFPATNLPYFLYHQKIGEDFYVLVEEALISFTSMSGKYYLIFKFNKNRLIKYKTISTSVREKYTMKKAISLINS